MESGPKPKSLSWWAFTKSYLPLNLANATSMQSLWLGFYQSGNTYLPNAPGGYVKEIYQMVKW